jgi:hypothetical protein
MLELLAHAGWAPAVHCRPPSALIVTGRATWSEVAEAAQKLAEPHEM